MMYGYIRRASGRWKLLIDVSCRLIFDFHMVVLDLSGIIELASIPQLEQLFSGRRGDLLCQCSCF
jgi:hypothetical protein